MEPNSLWLLVFLLAACCGLVYLIIKRRLLVTKIGCGVGVIVLAMGAGMAVVNDYYGYYQTWGALRADLSGNYGSYTAGTPALVKHYPALSGRLDNITMPGAQSSITRRGFVYLPPQYDQPAFANTRFPVVELVHGSPGGPVDYVVGLRLVQLMNTLISEHQIGPMVIVLPQMNSGHIYEEGVNGVHGRDDTYLSTDVPDDIRARYRVSQEPAEWGIGGYSSGGYCAANLALRHPGDYGAAAIMDGYFVAGQGPAAAALGDNAALERQNSPTTLAARLPDTVSPLPAFWVLAGTADRGDLAGEQHFVAALRHVEQATVDVEKGGSHNFYAWAEALPRALQWLWQELAPPQLRVQFPVTRSATITLLPPPLRRHASAHRHPTASSS